MNEELVKVLPKLVDQEILVVGNLMLDEYIWRVDVSGHCYQGDPLQGIKRFVKAAGIPNLERCIQDAKKEGRRLWRYCTKKCTK